MNHFDLVKLLVFNILSEPGEYEWTVQGFGMLRLHLPNNLRLHIWDSELRVPDVSDIHDHLQWGLESFIVAGAITNRRYRLVEGGLGYKYVTLKPGMGTHFKTEVTTCGLIEYMCSTMGAGDSYQQDPGDIHRTEFVDGTITLMKKFPTRDESARVFWDAGTEWVSAEPRLPTLHEILRAVHKARGQLAI